MIGPASKGVALVRMRMSLRCTRVICDERGDFSQFVAQNFLPALASKLFNLSGEGGTAHLRATRVLLRKAPDRTRPGNALPGPLSQRLWKSHVRSFRTDVKSDVSGKCVSGRVSLGGRR